MPRLNSPIRVLLVAKGPPEPGGLSSLVATILEAAVPGASLELLNLTRPDKAQAGRLSRDNVRVTIEDAWRVNRASRRAQIVHVHSALVPYTTLVRAGLLCLPARAGGARVLLHAHSGRIPGWFTTPFRRTLGRLLLVGANRVACVSRTAAPILTSTLGAERVVVVPNGVDMAVFRPDSIARPEPSIQRILYAGYIAPRKGVLELLAASERLQESCVPHEIVLAGGAPPESAQLDASIQRAVECSGALLIGVQPRPAMPALYRTADVFCLPSWWEGMSISLMEAMASGLPVVATAVGETTFMVEDGVTGLLVPPRDPDRLTEALASLLTDRARRLTMGRAAREFALAHFDRRSMCRRLSTVYSELVCAPANQGQLPSGTHC